MNPKRGRLLAFEPVDYDPKEYRKRQSNPAYWKRDGVRATFDAVYAPSYPEIEDAYSKAGKKIYRPSGEDVAQEPAEEASSEPSEATESVTEDDFKVVDTDAQVEAEKASDEAEKAPQDSSQEAPSEESVEEDWRNLSWPKMRSLATNFTDEPVGSKAKAIEVLEQAESEGKV